MTHDQAFLSLHIIVYRFWAKLGMETLYAMP